MTRMLPIAATALALGLSFSSAGFIPGDLIDFETLPDGTPTVDLQEIGTEYAKLGVTFTMVNDAGEPTGTPNIAKVGAPQTAFASCNGADTPLPGQSVGDSFLTDNTSVGNSDNLLITYAAPVAQAAGVILDVDCRGCGSGGNCSNCEQWTIEARDVDGNVIDTFIIDGEEGPPPPPCNDANGPGDARADGWFFDRAEADIASVLIRYTGAASNVGLAFDNFTPSSIPALVATADVSPTALCYGQVVELDGSAVGGVPPYTFTWQTEASPGVWIDVASGGAAVVAPSVDATIRLVVDDVSGTQFITPAIPVSVEPVVYEISQESAPGADDFPLNVLGTLTPYESDETNAEYYGWTAGNTPFSGPEPRLTNDRAHLFLVRGRDGLALYMVFDDDEGSGGGRAETSVDLACDVADFLVRDDASDASDAFNALNGGTRFEMRNAWGSGRTDGYVIGVLDCGWTADVQFADLFAGDPTINGLDSWSAYSQAGEVPLALEEERRVRISARVGCPADIDLSGTVDVNDLLVVLSLWGPCDAPCAADFNCDGEVGVDDLLEILAQWGPC